MTTDTDAKKQVPSLGEVDEKIANLRAIAAQGELSDYARYELTELLDLRRNLVLGRFERQS